MNPTRGTFAHKRNGSGNFDTLFLQTGPAAELRGLVVIAARIYSASAPLYRMRSVVRALVNGERTSSVPSIAVSGNKRSALARKVLDASDRVRSIRAQLGCPVSIERATFSRWLRLHRSHSSYVTTRCVPEWNLRRRPIEAESRVGRHGIDYRFSKSQSPYIHRTWPISPYLLVS